MTESYCVKKKTSRESWKVYEFTAILHKLDKDAEEQAAERERRRLLIEKKEKIGSRG